MLQQVCGRRSFVDRQPEARVQEVSQLVGRRVGQLVDGRVFRRDLEDGRDAFKLVPRRVTGDHLHHRAAKTPVENSRLKFAGVPQTRQQFSAVRRSKFTIL